LVVEEQLLGKLFLGVLLLLLLLLVLLLLVLLTRRRRRWLLLPRRQWWLLPLLRLLVPPPLLLVLWLHADGSHRARRSMAAASSGYYGADMRVVVGPLSGLNSRLHLCHCLVGNGLLGCLIEACAAEVGCQTLRGPLKQERS